jgi:FixJ family two-component response regulator
MNIILIDDSQKEIDKYSGIFRSNKFAKKNFTLVAVVLDSLKPDFQFSEKPDLILIDFRFDLPGGEGFYHDGYVLATALRNIYNEIPILIFTRRGIFNIQKFPNSIVDIADDIVFKSDFIKNEGMHQHI